MVVERKLGNVVAAGKEPGNTSAAGKEADTVIAVGTEEVVEKEPEKTGGRDREDVEIELDDMVVEGEFRTAEHNVGSSSNFKIRGSSCSLATMIVGFFP